MPQNREPPSNSPPEILAGLLSGNRLRVRSDIVAAGVHPQTLARAVEAGSAVPYARGIYMAPNADLPEGVGFAATTLLNPGGVVCLSSAALYHRLSDENPDAIFYAVGNKTMKVVGAARDPVRLVHWSEAARSIGVDTVEIAGVPVKITSPARTVVDMLRYRTKLGDEPAMKTLKDYAASGGDLNLVLEIARELGWTKSVEPAVRAAEEIQPLIPRPTL
ncbi:putative transcriptional regulator of viral defense system [Bradyrhizobium sp. USDA 4341]